MVNKPYIYKKHGYWNCRCDGFHGTGYSVSAALKSLIAHKLFWMNTMGLSYD